MHIQKLLNKLIQKENLTLEESKILAEHFMQGSISTVQMSAFLTALRMKDESVEELLAFMQVMRQHMVKLHTPDVCIDTCGTGGDGFGTFNISTAVALVVAGAGLKVAKHGNRAASSKSGSADVLEALGVSTHTSVEHAQRLLKEVGMCFLFAPLYHPGMKHVGPVRKELGVRTLFNYLGPFCNPAGVKHQMIGVPDYKMGKKLAEVATHLGYEHLMIVSSENGMDEISIDTKTHIFEVQGKKISEKILEPNDFGLQFSAKKISGGDAVTNANIIKDLLAGKKSADRDIVVVNAAAALYVGGRTDSAASGIPLAEQSIDSGAALKVLQNLAQKSHEKYSE